MESTPMLKIGSNADNAVRRSGPVVMLLTICICVCFAAVLIVSNSSISSVAVLSSKVEYIPKSYWSQVALQQRYGGLTIDLPMAGERGQSQSLGAVCGPGGSNCGPTRPDTDYGADIELPGDGFLGITYECCPCLGEGAKRIGYDQYDTAGFYNPYTMALCKMCQGCPAGGNGERCSNSATAYVPHEVAPVGDRVMPVGKGRPKRREEEKMKVDGAEGDNLQRMGCLMRRGAHLHLW